MLGTFNKCCFCISLRHGSFIISFLLLIKSSIQFILNCVNLSGINTILSAYTNHHLMLMYDDLGFFKLILSFEILIHTFELLINVALINGLRKRIQDQVQMFYVGGAIFFVLRLIITAVFLIRYGHQMSKHYGLSQWTIFSMEMLFKLLYIYFLFVIRSYYYVMQKEDVARWNVFSNSPIQLKINKDES